LACRTLAYFDNMLAADESVRRKKHELMLRVFDAAVLLGTDAVTGFVGRNPLIGMDANLVMFEEVFVAAARAGQSPWADVSGRAVSHAGLECH